MTVLEIIQQELNKAASLTAVRHALSASSRSSLIDATFTSFAVNISMQNIYIEI